MTYSILLEELIGKLGGCGLYQILITLLVHCAKTTVSWSMLTMAFAGQSQDFTCIVGNNSECSGFSGLSDDKARDNVCMWNKTFPCQNYCFHDNDVSKTIVSQWGLVCDRKWIPAMITSLQMVGVLLGSLVTGHVSDACGRKPAFFISLIITVLGNLIGYFSVSWEMYAVLRLIIGVGIGSFLTVQYGIMIEFASPRWRAAVVALPSFAIEACLLALVAWLVSSDWRKLHLAITMVGVPFIFTWFIMPESLRWLVQHQKFQTADHVVKVAAKVNGVSKPDLADLVEAVAADTKDENEKKIYTLLDLFRTRRLTFTTVGMMFSWLSSSLGYFGMAFGVSVLSRNVYLNTFLIFIVDVPILIVVSLVANSFGRRKVTIILYSVSAVGGVIVGILQNADMEEHYRTQIVTVVAMVAKLGVSGGSKTMTMMSVEIYPTSVRTIAYGVLHMAANVGGMVSPQIVLLNDDSPGLFLCGVGIFIAAIIMLFMQETNGIVLEDEIAFEKASISKIDSRKMSYSSFQVNGYNSCKKNRP